MLGWGKGSCLSVLGGREDLRVQLLRGFQMPHLPSLLRQLVPPVTGLLWFYRKKQLDSWSPSCLHSWCSVLTAFYCLSSQHIDILLTALPSCILAGFVLLIHLVAMIDYLAEV